MEWYAVTRGSVYCTLGQTQGGDVGSWSWRTSVFLTLRMAGASEASILFSLLSVHMHSHILTLNFKLKKKKHICKKKFQLHVSRLCDNGVVNMDHNWTMRPVPKSSQSRRVYPHKIESPLHLFCPELLIPAAWDVTWFVCPCEWCCCYASEGRREEKQTGWAV